MNSNIKIFSLFLSSCLLLITGCTTLINLSLASSEVVEIKDLNNEELLQNSLKVEGTVEKVIPLLSSHLYLLKDEAQLIWVLTHNQPPQKSESITIEAFLRNQKIVIEGKEYSEFYLEEIDRIPNVME